MKTIRVIVACEESQAVCKAFRERGFEAFSCDIEPCSGGHPEWHFQEDIFEILKRQPGFDLMIAHPPCTYLSNAGACRLYPKAGVLDTDRYEKGLRAKDFFMRLLNYPIAHIAVENPVSSRIFDMPPFTQEIQPYQFGHPYTKKTRLWLRNLPPLSPTNEVMPTGPYVPSGTGRKDRSKYGAAERGKDAKNRSKTFEGIARAMAEQWGDFLKKKYETGNRTDCRKAK